MSSRLQGRQCCFSKWISSSVTLQTVLPQVKLIALLQLRCQLKKGIHMEQMKLNRQGNQMQYSREWDIMLHCSIINLISRSTLNRVTHTCHHFTMSVSFITSASRSFRYWRISDCHPSSSSWLEIRARQRWSDSDRRDSWLRCTRS